MHESAGIAYVIATLRLRQPTDNAAALVLLPWLSREAAPTPLSLQLTEAGMRRQRLAYTLAATVLLTLPGLAAAQGPMSAQRRLSGPRFGMTFLTREMRDSIAVNLDEEVGPVITQFGWQWERQFRNDGGGLIPVTEWVLLVGGMEQGVFLPSLSWMVGLRTLGGTEFGLGPNLGPGGVGMVYAAGINWTSGNINIPLNIAVVPSSAGLRVGVLAGFNSQ